MSIEVTDFGAKVFDRDRAGTRITDYSRDQFEHGLNHREPVEVIEGYAPFCKLFFYENWTDASLGCIEVTEEKEYMLKTGYKARTEDELPVLSRWFEGVLSPPAKYLCVVCYDREQLMLEGSSISADWGVVAVLGTRVPEEQPLAPITMMRNALGIEEGGSGVPLNREAYKKAVEFWNKHALIH